MSDFKLEFTLKQHTPLIHFQHDQDGATLRATEVKARLDRFIREKFLHLQSTRANANIERLKKLVQEYFPKPNSKPTPSPYRLKLSGKISEKYLLHSQSFKDEEKREASEYLQHVRFMEKMPYFADNDKVNHSKWEDTKLGVTYSDVGGEIFSFNKDLLELLFYVLPRFFCLHNFGCRQSKGFGSFTILTLKGKEMEMDHSRFLRYLNDSPEWVYCEKIRTLAANASAETVLQAINSTYQKMKFKPNRPIDDSAIRDFFEDEGVSWEKPFITRELVKSKPAEPIDYRNESDKKYVRALLGLAELHDYQQFNIAIKISDPSGEVERFQSPIIFKVFENNIYVCARPVPVVMLNRAFEFLDKDDPAAKMTISTPGNFEIQDFLENYFKNRP